MFFKKKTAAPALPSIRIRSGEKVIYEGLLKDIPIKEKVLIEKSIYFFDDREPCFIHRDAVRVRLTEERTRSSLVKLPENPGGFCLPTRIFWILPPASFSESAYLSRK